MPLQDDILWYMQNEPAHPPLVLPLSAWGSACPLPAPCGSGAGPELPKGLKGQCITLSMYYGGRRDHEHPWV